MKPSKPIPIVAGAIAAVCLGVFPATAATLAWDGSDPLVAGAQGGSGTWDMNATANWWDGVSVDVVWPDSGTDTDAVFGSTAGTVTLAPGGVTANDLAFNTTGYTLQGGILTLNGGAPTITTGSGLVATINSGIAGVAGLDVENTLIGTTGGSLNLGGVSSIAGSGGQGTALSGVIYVGKTSAYNTLNLGNGGKLATVQSNRLLVIGSSASSGNNTVNVSTPGTSLSPSFVVVGQNLQLLQVGVDSSNNALNVSNGAYFGGNQTAGSANASYWLVGANVGSNNNSVTITGAGSTLDRMIQAGFTGTNTGSAICIGQQSDGNRVVASAGGLFKPLRLQIGSGSDGTTKAGTNNFVQITGRGSQTIISSGTNSIFDLGSTTGSDGNYLAIEAGAAFDYSAQSSTNATQGLIRNFKIGGLGNNNYLAVTGEGSILRVNAGNPIAIGGQVFSSNLPTDGGDGNRLDIGNGGWVDMTLANGAAGSTSIYVIGSATHASSINLGDGAGLSTLKAGASTSNGSLGSIYLKYGSGRLNLNNGRLIAGANGALVSGAGLVQLNGAAYIHTTQVESILSVVMAGGAAGSLTKESTGTLTLSADNTYTGATVIDGGTLNIGNGATGSLNGTTGTALTFTGSGVFNANQASGVSQGMGVLTFAAGAAQVQITNDGTSHLTFSSLAARTAGATANFVTAGAGTTTLTVAGQSVGVMNQGTFFGGSDYAYYDAGNFVRALRYNDPGAATSGATSSLPSVAHQEITGSIPLQTNATFTTLKINGPNNITLRGGQKLTVNGLLKVGSGSSVISGGSGIQAATNAELIVRTDAVDDTLEINTIILANGSNALTKDGAGNGVLGAPNTYTGATTINAGTLTYGVGNALAGGAVTVHNGTLDMAAYDDTVGAVTLREGSIAGTGTLTSTSGFTLNNHAEASVSVNLAGNVGLTKNGLGTATLSGVNIYTGGTTINTGALMIGTSGAIPINTLLNMGTDPSASLNLGGFDTLIGALAGGSATGGGITLGAGTLTVGGGASGSGTYSGVIAGTGVVAKIGSGTQTFSGYNSYTGVTRIDGGVLNASCRLAHGGFASSIGASTNSAGNLVFGGGTLQYTGAVTAVTDRLFTIGDAAGDSATLDASGSTALATLTFSSTGAIALDTTNAHVLTLTGTHTGNNLLATVLGDSTGLTSVVKEGAGTWILTGENTYGGGTTVNAGKLLANNPGGSATGTGPVHVGASGTLGGTGAISSPVNVTGVLAPGDAIGVLTSGALAMANQSTYQYQVNSSVAPGVGADLQVVAGALALGSPVTLSLTDLGTGSFAAGTVFSLFNYSSGLWNNGLFTYDSNVLADDSTFTFLGKEWTINYNATTKGANVAGPATGSYVNITLSGSGATAYDQWALNKNLTGPPGSTSDPAFDADPDKDGIPNGLEWVLGGDPTRNDTPSILPHVSVSGGSLILAFTREETSLNETLLVVEYGSDFIWPKSVTIGGNSAPGDANGVVVTVNTTAAPDGISVNIPAAGNTSGGKLFARLKVTRVGGSH